MGDWDITITDNNGNTHNPALYSPSDRQLPQRKPAANGRPTLEFGVQPERDSNGDPKWFSSEFEEADVSVSLDGVAQPYDTLVGFTDRPDAGLTILRARGGSEIEQRVETSLGPIPTHEAAEQVVTNTTSYGVDIPRPSTTTDQDVLVEDQTDGLASSDIEPQPEGSPVYVDADGDVDCYQTLHFDEPTGTLGSVGDTVSFSFDLGYSVPADRVAVGFLTDIKSKHVGVEFKIDDTVIGEIQPGAEYSAAPSWQRRVGAKGRLAPGTHTFTAECTAIENAAGEALNATSPNGLAVYDDKFSYDFDSALSLGPQLYPRTVDVEFTEPLVTRAVTGMRARGYWQDNEAGAPIFNNGVEVAVGPRNAGYDWDFGSPGPVASLKMELHRYGQDTSRTPEQGFKMTTLRGYKLWADLETLPLIVDETFEGTVAEVLTELADSLRGDFVWTFDTDASGNEIVRFVQTGSRQSTQSDIENYTVSKRVDRRLDQVRILGGTVDVAGEGVRVQHGQPKSLDRRNLVEGSEDVKSLDGSRDYELGVHYEMDYDAGTITAIANPSRADPIPDASRVRVSYQFQPAATVIRDGASEPYRSEVVDSLPLRSDRACRLAGQQILDQLSTPEYDATAQVRGNTTYSVVADLVSGRLPVSSLETVDIEADAAGASIRLEARRSFNGAVSDIRDRIESVARHTR